MDIEKLIEKAVGDLDRFGHMSSPGAQAGRRAILRAAFAEVRREAITEVRQEIQSAWDAADEAEHRDAYGLGAASALLDELLLPPAAEERGK